MEPLRLQKGPNRAYAKFPVRLQVLVPQPLSPISHQEPVRENLASSHSIDLVAQEAYHHKCTLFGSGFFLIREP